jgi:hypothetical protein
MNPPEKYGLKKFENLQTSTSTVMVYTNIKFDITKIFHGLKLTNVEIPLTKKQKNVDKKKITAPYGAIISVQSKTKVRGVDLKKKKKRWCTICQPIKVVNDKEVKVLTITEYLDVFLIGTDIRPVMYFCSKCQKSYQPEKLKKINHFLNQLTIVVSVGKQPLLNIMMFKDNLKIAGCKDKEDAIESCLILWQDYIKSIPGAWKLKKGAQNPRFIIDTVMRNVDFKLGFPIERPSLNDLMNSEKFRDRIFMSQYESSSHTNVNIKMFSKKPKNFKYDCLVIPLDESKSPYFISLDNIPLTYKKLKKKDSKEKYVTFIVFSSSETILSGRYDQNMKEMYEFFVDIAFKNRKHIEEKLDIPNKTAISKLKLGMAK